MRTRLSEYENNIGLTNIKYSDNVKQFLELNADQLRGMSAEECNIGSFELSRYASMIQKECNTANRDLYWAKHNLEIIVSKNADGFDKYKKFEERRGLVIAENEYAQSLNKLILESELRIQTLNFLSGKINTIANYLSELAQTKRYQK